MIGKALHVVILGTNSAPPGARRATEDHSVCHPFSSFRALQLKHEVNTGQIAFIVFWWFPKESVEVCKQSSSERSLLPRVAVWCASSHSLVSALPKQQVCTKGDSNSVSDATVKEIIIIKCFSDAQYQSSMTFIWSFASVWSSSVPLLSSCLLSLAKYFLTSLLQGQKRGLHQFSNDESPFINSKVREGWRFAARDKVGGRLETIHHWHRRTQSKSLLLYLGGGGERSKTLIVEQHFTRFVLDRLAEFISYVSLHVSSVLLSVLHSPNDAARSKVVRLPHTNQLSTTFPPSPAAALNSTNLAGKVSCYGIAVQEWVTYKV